MDSITLGVVCGLVFGIIDVLIMISIKVADRRKRVESLIAAFYERKQIFNMF